MIGGADPYSELGGYSWAVSVLIHGTGLFHSTLVNYPVGLNMALANCPLLVFITAPLTYFVSPVASFNLVMWLAFPCSALAMCYVLRKWSCTPLISFVGGLLYGFSPYLVGQGYGHNTLIFVPFPPLIIFGLYRVFVKQDKPIKWAFLTSLFCLCQFFISVEVLVTLAIVVAIMGGLIFLAGPRNALAHVRSVIFPVSIAGMLFVLIAGYPAWYMALGAGHYGGPVWGYAFPVKADLLGPILPTSSQLLYPTWLSTMGTRLAPGVVENGSYLGVPLLLAFTYVVVAARRNRWVLFSALMAILCFLLSLGNQLSINNHPYGIYLLFHLIYHISLFANVLPSRLSNYVMLFVVITVALGITEMQRTRPNGTNTRHSHALTAVKRGIGIFAGVVVVASLIPHWPYATGSVNTPTLFTHRDPSSLPSISGVALIYPYPQQTNDVAQVWQAESLMKFSIIGGYALYGTPQGATTLPAVLRPLQVDSIFNLATLNFPLTTEAAINKVPGVGLRRFIRVNNVSDIVIELSQVQAQPLATYVTKALARKPQIVEGFAVWTHTLQTVNGFNKSKKR